MVSAPSAVASALRSPHKTASHPNVRREHPNKNSLTFDGYFLAKITLLFISLDISQGVVRNVTTRDTRGCGAIVATSASLS